MLYPHKQHDKTAERLKASLESSLAVWMAADPKNHTKAELARRLTRAAHRECTPQALNGWIKTGRMDKFWLRFWEEETGLGLGFSAAPTSSNTDVAPEEVASDSLSVPLMDVRASMGLGALQADHDEVVTLMKISRQWLSAHTNYSSAENLALITGYGDSMQGTFEDGDILLVDRGVTEIRLDAVYVLELNGELYIKRLQRRPDGSILMISDNSKYEPYLIRNEEKDKFRVLGRVVLAWNAQRL